MKIKIKMQMNPQRRKRFFRVCCVACVFACTSLYHELSTDPPADPFKQRLPQISSWERIYEHKTQSRQCDPFEGTSEAFNSRQFRRNQQFEKYRSKNHYTREDLILYKDYFPGLCGGTYLEMGALDGIDGSNTLAFRRALNYSGMLIEGSPRNYKALAGNRLGEIAVVNAAVCEERQKVHFVELPHTGVGGIWEFAPDSFKRQWWQGVKLEDLPEVDCFPLKDIFLENIGEYTYFDIFSLDIEGAELSALKSIDFNTTGFGVILVESDKHDPVKNAQVKSFLRSVGYPFVNHRSNSDWFQNKDFKYIYQELLQ